MFDAKENNINFLLNHFMDRVMELPMTPRECVRCAISACLRFAARAAVKLDISSDELKKELDSERIWSEADERSNGSGSGVLN